METGEDSVLNNEDQRTSFESSEQNDESVHFEKKIVQAEATGTGYVATDHEREKTSEPVYKNLFDPDKATNNDPNIIQYEEELLLLDSGYGLRFLLHLIIILVLFSKIPRLFIVKYTNILLLK